MEICFRCSRVVDPENFLYGLHKDCFLSWFSLNSPAEFQDVVLARQENDSSFDGSPINASFLQGKFKKYSAKLDNHSYILKIQEEDYPSLNTSVTKLLKQ